MLVLSRRRQEAVIVSGVSDVDPTLKITVLELNGATVRLGFEAGVEVLIHRNELWERIRKERQSDQSRLAETLNHNPLTESRE